MTRPTIIDLHATGANDTQVRAFNYTPAEYWFVQSVGLGEHIIRENSRTQTCN